jgi:hypothetical protein
MLFLKSHVAANTLMNQFESLKSMPIVSIELDQYQRGAYDQSGKPTGKSRLAVITSVTELQEFKDLIHTNTPTRWNHFGVIDTYMFIVTTENGKVDFDAIRTGRPTDPLPPDLWIDFGANEGVYVPNLYKWMDSALKN